MWVKALPLVCPRGRETGFRVSGGGDGECPGTVGHAPINASCVTDQLQTKVLQIDFCIFVFGVSLGH